MDFERVTLRDRVRLEPYLRTWGGGSCQHSFTAMYCMADKYGEAFCMRDGYLFILRSGLCREGERVYLFPMGDQSDEAGMRRALDAVVEDAHEHGAKVRFETLTAETKNIVLRLMPGRFHAEANRDLAEYIYSYERLAELSGPDMRSRRHEVSAFFHRYQDRVRIERIEPRHMDELRAFQEFWVSSGQSHEDGVQLEVENSAIKKGLAHFDELGLSGIIVYVDGGCVGYAYGGALSPTHYDVIIEKGDRRVEDIYRVLNRELVRLCCTEYAFINREEDLGVAGLRKAKMSYKPDVLLEKYIVTEGEA